MPTFSSLIRDRAAIDDIARHLDALSPEARLAETVALTSKDQQALFEMAKGRGCTVDRDFTPGKGTLVEVIHEGKNSLPVFTRFQKRFARLDGAEPRTTGYNHQTMAPVTGPGYFTAREAELDGVKTVVIDYTLLPSEKVAGWPEILPNTARLSRFVYNGMQDWMWRVSEDVTIGRAKKASGWQPNWFVLCRQ